jgi:hypothetical protein
MAIGIPECIGIIGLSLSLAGLLLSPRKIIFYAVLMATAIYGVRQADLFWGFHSVMTILMLFLFIWYKAGGNALESFRAATIAMVTLAVLEYGCHTVLLSFFEMSIQAIFPNSYKWALMGLPHVVLLNLLAIFVRRRVVIND